MLGIRDYFGEDLLQRVVNRGKHLQPGTSSSSSLCDLSLALCKLNGGDYSSTAFWQETSGLAKKSGELSTREP